MQANLWYWGCYERSSYRLCLDQDVKGFSFSNVRDTASREVDKIDKAMHDLFLAHRHPRMAALYVDGEMVDPPPRRRVNDGLGRRLAIGINPRARTSTGPKFDSRRPPSSRSKHRS